MNDCSQCGAPLSRLDANCSFCGTANSRRELMAAEVEGLIARGQYAIQQGRPGEAVEYLARAVALEPEAFDAYFQLAAAWNQLGNSQRAIDAMLRARDVRPGNAALHYNIGMLSARQGQRFMARAYLWEVLRLLDSDAALGRRKGLFESTYQELASLGVMTDDEIAQLPRHEDAQGDVRNPTLSRCLQELDGPRTVGQTLRFYVALLRAHLLMPTAAASQKSARTALVQGPDKGWWLPVFTDKNALLAYRSMECAVMPAVLVARRALATPDAQGLVLNPTATGTGQPIERAGVEAVAKGTVVFLQI